MQMLINAKNLLELSLLADDNGCSCDNECNCNDHEPSINCGCDYNEKTNYV